MSKSYSFWLKTHENVTQDCVSTWNGFLMSRYVPNNIQSLFFCARIGNEKNFWHGVAKHNKKHEMCSWRHDMSSWRNTKLKIKTITFDHQFKHEKTCIWNYTKLYCFEDRDISIWQQKLFSALTFSGQNFQRKLKTLQKILEQRCMAFYLDCKGIRLVAPAFFRFSICKFQMFNFRLGSKFGLSFKVK